MSLKKADSTKRFYYSMLMRIIIIMTVIMLLLTCVLYVLLNNAVLKNIKNTEAGIAQNTSIHAFDYFDQLSYISTYFLSFQRNVPLDSINSDTSFWLRKSIKDNISSYIFSHDYITNIYVKIDNMEFSEKSIKKASDDIIETFVCNNISYSEESEWPHNLYFSNINNGNHSYNDVVIEVSSLALSKKILDADSERLQYIIDKNGNIISALQNEEITTNIYSRYKISESDIKDKYFSLKIKNKQHFVTVQNIKNTTLQIVSFTPKSLYSDMINMALIETIIIGFVLQVVTIISCYYIISRIYRPIKDITKTFQYHFPDNDENFGSEIEYINANIKQTIQSKENLEKELPIAIQRIHRLQVEALQSQINPHFLYNTLENIKVISVDLLDIDNPIEESLVLLNTILVESINRTEIIVPLDREINLSKSYIELMKIRYCNNFEVFWDIDDSLKYCCVLKLIMQPLIENSILHGFSNTGTNQKISIRIFKVNTDLKIKVSDNGYGIPAEKLEKLQSILLDTPESSPSKHIGLINVHTRIRLLYGNNYGLQIESSSKGTECTLTLPEYSELYGDIETNNYN